MSEFTVRLQDAANITQRSRESLRNGQKSADEPWYQDAFPEGQHRRYNGEHLLRLIIMEMLVKQGCEMAIAAQFVRSQGDAISLFLAEIADFSQPLDRFVWVLQVAHEDEWTGPRWDPRLPSGSGTKEELLIAFTEAVEATGKISGSRDGRSKIRQIGGPSLSVASIPEAYRLLKHRAKAAQFLIEGDRVIQIVEATGDEVDL